MLIKINKSNKEKKEKKKDRESSGILQNAGFIHLKKEQNLL